jgi:hypothetical protein
MTTVKKAPPKAKSDKPSTKASKAAKDVPELRSRAERLAAGKLLRDTVPRTSHAEWKPSKKRRDPIDVLEESNKDRVRELVPIRYGRMLRSPFTFLRGSAGLMAYDLATTPNTGVRIELTYAKGHQCRRSC